MTPFIGDALRQPPRHPRLHDQSSVSSRIPISPDNTQVASDYEYLENLDPCLLERRILLGLATIFTTEPAAALPLPNSNLVNPTTPNLSRNNVDRSTTTLDA